MPSAIEALFGKANDFLSRAVRPWWDKWWPSLGRDQKPLGNTYLLSSIFLQLVEMNEQLRGLSFGAEKFDVKPVALTTNPQRILEKDNEGRVRKVSVWVDPASGGPTPTVRIGTSANGSSSGGVRINAGTVAELGEVPPGTELWGVASTSIVAYIIERI